MRELVLTGDPRKLNYFGQARVARAGLAGTVGALRGLGEGDVVKCGAGSTDPRCGGGEADAPPPEVVDTPTEREVTTTEVDRETGELKRTIATLNKATGTWTTKIVFPGRGGGMGGAVSMAMSAGAIGLAGLGGFGMATSKKWGFIALVGGVLGVGALAMTGNLFNAGK